MDISQIIDFVHSIALLLSIGLLYDLKIINKFGKDKIYQKIITGLGISLIGAILMSTPWEFSPGYFFDSRTVLMGISGLFFGSLSTIISLILLALYRVYQGGGGVIPGMLWVIIPACSGLLWRRFRPRRDIGYTFFELLIFGILIHIFVLMALFTLPFSTALALIRNVSLPVLLIFPLGTALLGLVLVGRLERKKSEIQLRRLATVIEQLDEKVIITDLTGRPVYLNRFFKVSTGYDTADIIGQNLGELKSGHQDSQFYSHLWDTITRGNTWNGQIMNKRKDGTLYYDDATIFPIKDDMGEIINYASFQRDITEQIKMRELMVQNEKMLSVGGLAAGMAHEINNPLAGMMQSAEVIANRLGNKQDSQTNKEEAERAGTSMEAIKTYMESREIFRMLSSIKTAGKKVSVIVENMISFSQTGDVLKTPNQIEELLDRTLEIAETDFDLKNQYAIKDILITKNIEKGLPPVICKGSKIQQVLLNILRNSAQAMQDAETVDPGIRISISHELESHMILLEIEDNGPGITRDVVSHIFEPFFTTKPVGSGTGLGLSVSYFIIKEEHGGEISVSSELGRGAKISIRLPL